VWAALLVAWLARPAAAQGPPAETVRVPDDSAGARLLPRADFSFGWAGLVAADNRFDWHATIGFDLDLFDYGSGRLRFRGDYEAMLGRERRRYDLNQNNYAFEISGTKRFETAEVAVLSQHVSRHVVDRDNPPSISWNTLGARVRSVWTPKSGFAVRSAADGAGERSHRVEGDLEMSRAMQQAYVDYAWISRARVTWRRPVSPVVALHATATGEVVGVKRGLVRNERVCGGRIEGGVRVRGRAASLEIFGGYERRIDAYPTDRFRVRWFTAGARIVTSAF
jgi:hypothetical protein